MDIDRILKMKASSDDDMLGMILSNNIDIVYQGKACVSINNWSKLKSELLAWRKISINTTQRISGWIEFESNKKLFNEEAKKNCWCKFEDGTVIRYKQEHPMEIMTHFKLAKTVVK